MYCKARRHDDVYLVTTKSDSSKQAQSSMTSLQHIELVYFIIE